jgi:hypothetical protein
MMAALGWSEKRVRGFTQRMVKAGKWAKRGAHSGAKAPTILTVCKYALFQSPPKDKGEGKGEAEGERGAKEGRSEGEEQKEGINKGNELERKEREASPPAPALPIAEALMVWTEAAQRHGWKPAKPALSDDRRKRLGARLREHGLDGWAAAIARAEASALLRGPDPPGWFNFGFLLSPENFLKLSEGNYDERFDDNRQQGRSSNWGGAYARSYEMPC